MGAWEQGLLVKREEPRRRPWEPGPGQTSDTMQDLAAHGVSASLSWTALSAMRVAPMALEVRERSHAVVGG